MIAALILAAVTHTPVHPSMQWRMPLYVTKVQVVAFEAAGNTRSLGKGDPGKWCGQVQDNTTETTVYSCVVSKADPVYTYVVRMWRASGRMAPDTVCIHVTDGWLCGPGSEK